ncbi:hypothetical protein MCBRY_001377 [Methylocystis bryophila]
MGVPRKLWGGSFGWSWCESVRSALLDPTNSQETAISAKTDRALLRCAS